MPKLSPSLFILLACAALAPADELRTLSGKTVSGSLTSITASEITVKTAEGPVATPLAQALLLDFRPVREIPAGTTYSTVQLLDDTLLRCKSIAFQAKDAELTLLSGPVVRVPLSSLVAVLRDAQDPAIAKQWSQVARQKVRRDRVFILRDGELNPLEGTLGDVDAAAQTIQFTRDGAAPVALPFARVTALMFHRTELPTEQALCRVIDQDGSTLVASKLGFDGTTLTLGTTFGSKLELKQEVLARLDFNFGKLTYLSDATLEPKVVVSPWLGGINPVRRDVNLDGNPITLQDKQYAKGLSMYAGTALEFPLAGKYKEFKATLGADTRIAEEGQGEVVVTIYCDGDKRFSETVSARTPRLIALNVQDVASLRIVVAGRDFTNLSGHATLAEARISQ